MNIEKLLRSLGSARKLREALLFHSETISGIDVPKHLHLVVQSFIKQIFKELKLKKFDIKINHWGQISLIEPYTNITVLLSVCYCLPDHTTKRIKQELVGNNYFDVSRLANTSLILCIRFKASRSGTKWRTFSFPFNKYEFKALARLIVEDMQVKASGLSRNISRELKADPREITLNDILAVIRYGAAKLGRNNSLYYLSVFSDKNYVNKCIVKNNEIQLYTPRDSSYPYLLNKQSLKIINQLLNCSTDEELVFD